MKTISKTRKFYSTPDPLNFRPSPEFHANKTRFLHSPEPNIQNKNAENDLRQNVKQIFGLQFHKPHCGAHSFAIDRIDREQINNIQFPNARLEIIYPKIHFEFRALPRPIIIILLFVYTIWICFLISRILPTPIERTKKKKIIQSINQSTLILIVYTRMMLFSVRAIIGWPLVASKTNGITRARWALWNIALFEIQFCKLIFIKSNRNSFDVIVFANDVLVRAAINAPVYIVHT